MITNSHLRLETMGAGQIIDITASVAKAVAGCGISNGLVNLFIPGSTGGLTTLEYEPGLRKDLPELLEKLVPSTRSYEHDKTWGDGNGYSHLRAALIGASVSVPFISGELQLGTWQQIVFCEFDNRPRQREIIVTILGE